MSEGPTRPHADEKGFSLPSRPPSAVDVFFGEQRVFSVAPTEFSVQEARVSVDWPGELQPRLHGCTQLVVKVHLTGDVLLDNAIQLGDSSETISITDREGRPLAVDKFGTLTRMFTETDGVTARALAGEVARLAEDVNSFGVAGYLAYGSLLGAVRNGRLIGHDTDTDMAYLTNRDHPADIARESFALERFLIARGWTMVRISVGMIRAVFGDQAGDARHIDIFVSVHDGTHYYLYGYVHAEIPVSALVPLSTVILEGVQIPAPADPDSVLAATYGPTYAVPDPSFSYDPPRPLRRKSLAWMGDYRLHSGHWVRPMRHAWRTKRRPKVSGFARWVAEQDTSTATIVDLGCGMGSDALWFARSGRRVIGIDYTSLLSSLRNHAARREISIEFRKVSFYNVRMTLAAGAQLAGEEGDLVLYSRNLLDVLELEGRTNFWLLARAALLRGGRLYLRFRTRSERSGVADPGFRALDPDVIEAEARQRGAMIVSREDKRGATLMVIAWV